METCGLKCLKYLMFLLNLLFLLSGSAMVGVGGWVLLDAKSFIEVVASVPIIIRAVYVLIAVGAALVFIAFFGCCGAIKESKQFLQKYLIILLVILLIEIVVGVLLFVFYPRVQGLAIDSMNLYDSNSTAISNPPIFALTKAWDTFQSMFQCCGFKSHADWSNSTWVKLDENDDFPMSCCVHTQANNTEPVSCTSDDEDSFFSIGCEAKIGSYYYTIGGVCIAILAVEIISMIFAYCLYSSIKGG